MPKERRSGLRQQSLVFVRRAHQGPARAAQLDDMLTDGVQAKPDLGLPRSPCHFMPMFRSSVALASIRRAGERHEGLPKIISRYLAVGLAQFDCVVGKTSKSRQDTSSGLFWLIVDQLNRVRQIWSHGTGDHQLLFRLDAFRSRR